MFVWALCTYFWIELESQARLFMYFRFVQWIPMAFRWQHFTMK